MTLAPRCVAAFLLLSAPLLAQPAKDGPTYTSPAEADEDFAFAGEYVGSQRLLGDPRGAERIGVQVIALGNGKFSAVKYLGGLPGDGWRGRERILLEGERAGDVVRMKGKVTSLVVTGQSAEVVDDLGNRLGQLQRVNRVSPTMGAKPPEGAIVLFDGAGTEKFKNGKLTKDGFLAAGTETKDAWNNFRLHGEFLLPYKPLARGQNRGNSGFYLQGRYELQVLDSFGLEGVENECGGLYRLIRRP